MTKVNCWDDSAWKRYVASNPAIWGFERQLRPTGTHVLPVYSAPPGDRIKVVLAGPPASGKTTTAKAMGITKAFTEPVYEWTSVGPDASNILLFEGGIGPIMQQVFIASTCITREVSPASDVMDRSVIDAWGIFSVMIPPEGDDFVQEIGKCIGINELTAFMSAVNVTVIFLRSPASRSYARRRKRGHASDEVSFETHNKLVEAHERFYTSEEVRGFKTIVVDTANSPGHDHADTAEEVKRILETIRREAAKKDAK